MTTKQIELQTLPPLCLKTTDAAKYIGIAPRSLLDLMRARKIPHTRITERKVVFQVSDLDAYVATHRVEA